MEKDTVQIYNSTSYNNYGKNNKGEINVSLFPTWETDGRKNASPKTTQNDSNEKLNLTWLYIGLIANICKTDMFELSTDCYMYSKIYRLLHHHKSRTEYFITTKIEFPDCLNDHTVHYILKRNVNLFLFNTAWLQMKMK